MAVLPVRSSVDEFAQSWRRFDDELTASIEDQAGASWGEPKPISRRWVAAWKLLAVALVAVFHCYFVVLPMDFVMGDLF